MAVLGLPVNCMTHKERWLCVTLYHRYAGTKQNAAPRRVRICFLWRQAEAVTVGLALRFVLIFAAGTTRPA